jgi:formate hydrogenlyase subunit 3/multisubunit Na+/H+ antiporter MnhD subunit
VATELLIVALGASALGLVAALLTTGVTARALSFAGLGVGALLAFVGAAIEIGSGRTATFTLAGTHFALLLDGTSSFFVALISFIAGCYALYALAGQASDERHAGRAVAVAANLMWLGAMVLCGSADVWLFLFGWELVAFGFYVSIAYGGSSPQASTAAYYTLVLTHVAGAAVMAALLILVHVGSTFDPTHAAAAAALLGPTARAVLLFLLLAGFGAKIGLVPLHGWMPYGYSAAPSAAAAFMAGGILNVGFYGIVRFVIGFGGPIPVWFAIVVLVLGALGAFFGIAWAQAQKDLRSLAAFSSVENAGLIVIGFGVALVGRAEQLPLLTGLGLAAAYVQIAAHALSKALLFLCASGLRDAARSTSFDLLGGQLKRAPLHALAGGIAALSLAALPPLGGFAGEWLILESCMQAFRTGDRPAEVAMALAGATVGIAAGIAVVAFVKVVGIALLGAPRSVEAAHASEVHLAGRILPIGLLAAALVGLGIATPWYLRAIGAAVDGPAGAPAVAAMTATLPLIQPTFPGFSSASGLGLGVTIALAALGFAILVSLVRRPLPRREPAWTSGNPYEPWTQYTGTGFANPTRVILDAAVRTQRVIVGSVRESGATTVQYESAARPYFELPFALAIGRRFVVVAAVVRKTQSGIIATYLSYILAFAIIVLILYPSIRRW